MRGKVDEECCIARGLQELRALDHLQAARPHAVEEQHSTFSGFTGCKPPRNRASGNRDRYIMSTQARWHYRHLCPRRSRQHLAGCRCQDCTEGHDRETDEDQPACVHEAY